MHRGMQAYPGNIPSHAPPRGGPAPEVPGPGRPTWAGRPTPPGSLWGWPSSGWPIAHATSLIRVPPPWIPLFSLCFVGP